MLKVIIYDGPSSSAQVRFRGRMDVDDLNFSTQLPGGFGQCSFVVTGAAAEMWRIDTGQKVIVWHGRNIVWYGWIEDIQRSIRGITTLLTVTCLGPYQICNQRLIETFTGNLETSEAVKAALLLYADRISANYDNITATGITSGEQAKKYIPVADIIKDACSTGNSSDQQMLFAIWEPNLARLEPLVPTNLVVNGGFETAGVGLAAAGWTHTASSRDTVTVFEGSAALVFNSTVTTCTAKTTDYITVKPEFEYLFNLVYVGRVDTEPNPCVGGYLTTIEIEWYDSGSSLLSTTTWSSSFYATYDYPDCTCEWQTFMRFVTAPASATKAKILLTGGAWGAVDNVTLYDPAELGGVEAKPIAHLWPRDLSDYDYMVYTARMESPWRLEETTRQLVNAVWVNYQSAYTGAARDSASQTNYRRRDVVVSAGEIDETLANQYRDTYLARWKNPTEEPSTLTAQRTTILNKRGLPIDPVLLRAGDRIKIMDGLRTGTIVLINSTSYRNGVMSLEPDRYASVTELLARSV